MIPNNRALVPLTADQRDGTKRARDLSDMVGAARREFRLSPNQDTALGLQVLTQKMNVAAKENRRSIKLVHSR